VKEIKTEHLIASTENSVFYLKTGGTINLSMLGAILHIKNTERIWILTSTKALPVFSIKKTKPISNLFIN
jgi:hypothetical protein